MWRMEAGNRRRSIPATLRRRKKLEKTRADAEAETGSWLKRPTLPSHPQLRCISLPAAASMPRRTSSWQSVYPPARSQALTSMHARCRISPHQARLHLRGGITSTLCIAPKVAGCTAEVDASYLISQRFFMNISSSLALFFFIVGACTNGRDAGAP
jgi:hypothetical protein